MWNKEFWIRNYTCYWELHLIKIINNDLKNMSYSSKEANMWKVSKRILFNFWKNIFKKNIKQKKSIQKNLYKHVFLKKYINIFEKREWKK